MSNRLGSASGVIQCANGRSRSARSTSPRRVSSSDSECSRASSAARSASQSSLLTSESTSSGPGPASSTPDSSKVSRTAAQTSARASGSAQEKASAHACTGGPAQPISAEASSGSTEPPGNTCMPPAKLMPLTRRSRYASGPPGRSRSSTTVAACRGTAAVRLPSASPRTRAARPSTCRPGVTAGARSRARQPDDQLDLDGGVERQRRDADRRAGVPTGVAEDVSRAARWRR